MTVKWFVGMSSLSIPEFCGQRFDRFLFINIGSSNKECSQGSLSRLKSHKIKNFREGSIHEDGKFYPVGLVIALYIKDFVIFILTHLLFSFLPISYCHSYPSLIFLLVLILIVQTTKREKKKKAPPKSPLKSRGNSAVLFLGWNIS